MLTWGMYAEILPWAALALVLPCDPKLFLAPKSSVSMRCVQTRPQATWGPHGESWHTNTHWGSLPGDFYMLQGTTDPWLQMLVGSFNMICINPNQVYYQPADSYCLADTGSTHFQKCFNSTLRALPIQVGRQGSNDRGSRLTGLECCHTGSECPKQVTCSWAQKWVCMTCTLGSLALLSTHPISHAGSVTVRRLLPKHWLTSEIRLLVLYECVEFQPCVDKPVLL